jgi:hypothetical protein
MYRVCTLVDAVVNGKQIAGLFLQADSDLNGALPVNTQLYCTDGTDRRTPAAKGAFILLPKDYPRQIFYA